MEEPTKLSRTEKESMDSVKFKCPLNCQEDGMEISDYLQHECHRVSSAFKCP